jgi:hypothetical protein
MVLFAGTTFAQTSQTLGPAASSNEPFSMSIANPKDTRERQFNFEIKPGSRIEDYVIVQNLADHPLHFSLYAANPTLSNTGSPAYKTRAETSGDGPGSWIKFDQPEVDLNANQTGKIRFTVNIPPQTPLGDYRAGLAMEKSRQDINNPSITINARFIIQTNIKVTNTPGPNRNQVNANFGWRDYYFWGSTTMFIISLALLIWITVHEKFHKKHHRQGKKHHTD